jgi:hypothetical protein
VNGLNRAYPRNQDTLSSFSNELVKLTGVARHGFSALEVSEGRPGSLPQRSALKPGRKEARDRHRLSRDFLNPGATRRNPERTEGAGMAIPSCQWPEVTCWQAFPAAGNIAR